MKVSNLSFQMFNIFTPGYNLHMCMDIMARIQMSPILVIKAFSFYLIMKNFIDIFQILHFDCMRFGQDQVAFLKPEDNGGLMETMEGSEGGDSQGSMMVVYDHVDFDKRINSTIP
jgi:hypothetical protein